MRQALLVALGAVLALAAPGLAEAGPGVTVGAVEDDVRVSSAVEAETRMALFRAAGFRAVRVVSLWQPGQVRPTEAELGVIENVAEAASRNGVRVYVTVMHPGSRTTPLTDEARGEFAANAAALVREVPGVRHVIVGNEPNLNRFWLPCPPRAISCCSSERTTLSKPSRRTSASTGARSPHGAATGRAERGRRTHLRSSSRTSASRTARAAATDR